MSVAALGAGLPATVGTGVAAFFAGPLLRSWVDGKIETRKGLSAAQEHQSRLLLNHQFMDIIRSPGLADLPEETKKHMIRTAKRIKKRDGFTKYGPVLATGAATAGAAAVLTTGAALHMLILPVTAGYMVNKLAPVLDDLSDRSGFAPKEAVDALRKHLLQIQDKLKDSMEYPEGQEAAIEAAIAKLSRIESAAKSANEAVEQQAVLSREQVAIAQSPITAGAIEINEQLWKMMTDLEGLTASLKFVVTSGRMVAYWTSNMLGLFQQSIMADGLSAENVAFLAGGTVAGIATGGSLPATLVGAQMARTAFPEILKSAQMAASAFPQIMKGMNAITGGNLNRSVDQVQNTAMSKSLPF